MPGLVLADVGFVYPKSKKPVLENVQATFEPGSVSSIQGYSGAGKSTLLYLIAGMDVPTRGKLLWNDRPVEKRDLTEYRRKTVSLIAQSYLLFPTRTALENVCDPLLLDGKSKDAAAEEAREYLRAVRIGEDLHGRLPGNLSGGEQQRVAIARCLASHTPLIAADEPTGNLDEENTREVMDILTSLARGEGKTIIIVTHDRTVAELAQEQYVLTQGKLLKV